MPAALAITDRKLLAAAGVLALILITLSVLFAQPDEQDSSPVPSSYSSGSNGSRAAYLLLQRMNIPVERWEQSPSELPTADDRSVLVLANPSEYATEKERKALARFAASGGRILFTGSTVGEFFLNAAFSH